VAYRIRDTPSLEGGEVGLVTSGSVVDREAKPVKGFYELTGGKGYITATEDDMSWEELDEAAASEYRATTEENKKIDNATVCGLSCLFPTGFN
jgi:hypothetical protein